MDKPIIDKRISQRADEFAQKEYISDSYERDALSKGYYWGYKDAEKDLAWISVNDRLPEVGHFVLACVSDTGTPQCVGMALLLEDGTWWDGDWVVRVDYWMEVPQLKENNYGM